MRQKKAKLIRKIAKAQGLCDPSKKDDYKAIKTKKMKYIVDAKGSGSMVPVEKITYLSAANNGYRKLKKTIQNNAITISSLKHTLASTTKVKNEKI